MVGRQPLVTGAAGSVPARAGDRRGWASRNGSRGRMASQRKSSTKLGMSKRRSAAGRLRVSASWLREKLFSWWNGLSRHSDGGNYRGGGNQDFVHGRLLRLRCQVRFKAERLPVGLAAVLLTQAAQAHGQGGQPQQHQALLRNIRMRSPLTLSCWPISPRLSGGCPANP